MAYNRFSRKNSSKIMKKTSLLLKFLSLLVIPLCAQTPPTFQGSMTKSTLETYLARSAFFDYANEGCYYKFINPTCFNTDKPMLQNTKPFMLCRFATSWGGQSYADFTEENEMAQKIHTEIDNGIILEGFISEFVTKNISPTGSILITIPTWAKTAFGYTGNATYFDHAQMAYSDVNMSNPCGSGSNQQHVWCSNGNFEGVVPDITKVMTKMWYYYIARTLIDYKYEAITLGQWRIINDADNGNNALWDLLSKIRTYANTNAKRNLVLISSDGAWSQTGFGNDAPNNNLPYRNYVSGNSSNQMLFDFMVNVAHWDEDGYVANGNNPFYKNSPTEVRNERFIKLPGSFTDFQFGGLTAQSWNWSSADRQVIPQIFHLDVGGGHTAASEGDLNNQYPSYQTWGWGGEVNYLMYTSLPYRRYLIHKAAHEIRERGISAYLMMPMRAPVSSWYYRFNAPYTTAPYNLNYSGQAPEEVSFIFRCNDGSATCATTETNYQCYPPHVSGQMETQIKEVWDKSLDISFCTPSIFNGDFTEFHGYNSKEQPRFLMDVDGDGDKDIVGIGNSEIKVSKWNGSSFAASTVFTNSTAPSITYNKGWRAKYNVRTYGDFNNDGKEDLIGFGSDGVWVGISNGSSFTFTKWSTDFANISNSAWNSVWVTYEWGTYRSVRAIGDINNDGRDDIVGYGDAGVYVSLANATGTGFNPKTIWFAGFGYNQFFDNTHVRLVADIDNNGFADLFVFGPSGTQRVLNNNGNSGTAVTVINDLGSSQGWNVNDHSRQLCDLDNDGDLDVVAFGNEGVFISKNTNSNYSTLHYLLFHFGTSARAGGFTNGNSIRLMRDVNGDSRPDIVCFGPNGLDVVPLKINAADTPDKAYFGHIFHYQDFGSNNNAGGWDMNKHVRTSENFAPSDSRSELICFGGSQVYIMNNCNGSFFGSQTVDIQDQVESDSKSDYSLSPNPASGMLYVTFKEGTTVQEMHIFDLQGKKILSLQPNINATDGLTIGIDLSGVPNGAYMLVPLSREYNLSRKLFVKTER